MPQYVVMPNSKEEIASIIRLLNQQDIAYVVRAVMVHQRMVCYSVKGRSWTFSGWRSHQKSGSRSGPL